jgi:hypothetical protein
MFIWLKVFFNTVTVCTLYILKSAFDGVFQDSVISIQRDKKIGPGVLVPIFFKAYLIW